DEGRLRNSDQSAFLRLQAAAPAGGDRAGYSGVGRRDRRAARGTGGVSYFARSDELPEWVASIPDGWGIGWLKWSVDVSAERPTEAEQEALPYISNEDIASWTGKLLIDELKPAESESRVFLKGDVLFNKL